MQKHPEPVHFQRHKGLPKVTPQIPSLGTTPRAAEGGEEDLGPWGRAAAVWDMLWMEMTEGGSPCPCGLWGPTAAPPLRAGLGTGLLLQLPGLWGLGEGRRSIPGEGSSPSPPALLPAGARCSPAVLQLFREGDAGRGWRESWECVKRGGATTGKCL